MRYELKMVFPETEYMAVVNNILGSSKFVREIYHERQINNIYFDTLNYTDYFANLHGDSHRKKYRIRWYGPSAGEITSPTLELKYKRGLCGGKKMIPVPKFRFNGAFDFCRYAGEIEKILPASDEQGNAMLGELLQRNPVLYNSYVRRYFLTKDGKYRITLDKHLWYSPMPVALLDVDTYSRYEHMLVLEIKFDEKDFPGASSLINELGYSIDRNSKYVNGIQATAGYL